MSELSITKSTVECYKIRHPKGHFWADINIDADWNRGRIQIASDFGDWQNYWGACGQDFKEFLLNLDKGYAAGKFGADHYFDCDTTVAQLKRDILIRRRSEEFTADKAREAYREAKELEDEGYRDGNAFGVALMHTAHLWGIQHDTPDLTYTCEPGFNNFWSEVWPFFVSFLKAELQPA